MGRVSKRLFSWTTKRKELPLTERGKLGGALSVGAIQEVNIGSVKLEIPLNIWMYILGKQLDMNMREEIQINNSKWKY